MFLLLFCRFVAHCIPTYICAGVSITNCDMQFPNTTLSVWRSNVQMFTIQYAIQSSFVVNFRNLSQRQMIEHHPTNRLIDTFFAFYVWFCCCCVVSLLSISSASNESFIVSVYWFNSCLWSRKKKSEAKKKEKPYTRYKWGQKKKK